MMQNTDNPPLPGRLTQRDCHAAATTAKTLGGPQILPSILSPHLSFVSEKTSRQPPRKFLTKRNPLGRLIHNVENYSRYVLPPPKIVFFVPPLRTESVTDDYLFRQLQPESVVMSRSYWSTPPMRRNATSSKLSSSRSASRTTIPSVTSVSPGP